jgi:hypothetical protein
MKNKLDRIIDESVKKSLNEIDSFDVKNRNIETKWYNVMDGLGEREMLHQLFSYLDKKQILGFIRYAEDEFHLTSNEAWKNRQWDQTHGTDSY